MSNGIWIKVHEDVLEHPKFLELDNDAVVMWLSALLYCKRHQLDGVFPKSAISVLPKVKRWRKCLQILLESEIFSESSDGKNLVICNFLQWQTSKAEIDEKNDEKRKNREKVAKHRAERKRQAQEAAEREKQNGNDVTVTSADVTPLRVQSQSTEPEPESLLIAEAPKPRPVKEKADSVSTRPRNVVWDAVVEVCSIDTSSIPKSQASLIGKVVAELAGLEATPEDIRSRGGIYKRKFPNVPLTPTALLKQWAGLTERSIPVGRPTNAGAQRQTAQAAALRMVLEASA